MRFMTLTRSSERSKVGAPPPELMQAMARLAGEAAQAGVLVDTAGLLPTAAGARVRLQGGAIATSDGPFASDREVVGAYAIFNVSSKQEAIAWVKRFLDIHKEHWKGWEGETEVRQLMEMSEGAGGNRG